VQLLGVSAVADESPFGLEIAQKEAGQAPRFLNAWSQRATMTLIALRKMIHSASIFKWSSQFRLRMDFLCKFDVPASGWTPQRRVDQGQSASTKAKRDSSRGFERSLPRSSNAADHGQGIWNSTGYPCSSEEFSPSTTIASACKRDVVRRKARESPWSMEITSHWNPEGRDTPMFLELG